MLLCIKFEAKSIFFMNFILNVKFALLCKTTDTLEKIIAGITHRK